MKNPTILTIEGEYFDFANPGTSPFTIETIAHGLSNICRFNGQCREFYSVAQHSYMVSFGVPAENALAGLLHDAAEAFVGDMTRPLKQLLPSYSEIERRVELAIFQRFKICPDIPASVKHADLVMLATEQRDLMNNRDLWTVLEGIKPLQKKIDPWPPLMAKRAFLSRFAVLNVNA